MDASRRQFPPLSQEQYECTFKTLASSSTEWDAMFTLIAPVIEKFNGNPVRFLSIGAGTGAFEDRLVTEHGLKLKYFRGVEPSRIHCSKLKATVAQWHVENDIVEGTFSPDLDIGDGYDLVLMSHVMYYVKDPLAVMKKAKSLLASGGSVIIFNHTHEGGAELQGFVRGKGTLAPQAGNECLTAKMLSEQLQSAGVDHHLTECPSDIDVHEFILKHETAAADHVVSFFIQTPFKDLSEPLQSEVYNLVNSRSSVGENGRYALSQPSAMLEIFSE